MSMRVFLLHPYTKFEVRGLPVLKIWLIFGHGIYPSGDLTFDLFPLNGVTGTCQFSACYALTFSLNVRHGTDRRTDRRSPAMFNAPILWKPGHNNVP